MSEKYEESWNSLKKHQTPEWLHNAKFGIYFHWGVYSVPEFGNEWYPHKMYIKIYKEFKFHKKNFGDQSKFGYKDLIQRFMAEKFDPNDWAQIFKDAGAKFAGPVAEHHDGFSMWKSELNPWNAYDMGPKRDIVGEMEKAIRSKGLKFICTFHHSYNWYYYYHSKKYDTGDPAYSKLYGPLHENGPKEGCSNLKYDRPSKEFLEFWFGKIKEVIDNYKPDLIWFDFGLNWIPDKYKKKMAAYYYNRAEDWGKEVEIVYKHHDLPPNIGLADYERGRSSNLTYFKWMTDTSIGVKSWSYIKNEKYKSTLSLIQTFIDIISKNGILLLNIGPKYTGEIPEIVRERLIELGNWISKNKEAIYDTTPWSIAEEGPSKLKGTGGFNERKKIKYTNRDFRFVSKNNSLYIFQMDSSNVANVQKNEVKIKTFAKSRPLKKIPLIKNNFVLLEESDIESIKLVENNENLTWKIDHEGLTIKLDESSILTKNKFIKFPLVFKINCIFNQ
ncbi:MAG: alpha-L-fucosidase [Promethearchaeota archaeon]